MFSGIKARTAVVFVVSLILSTVFLASCATGTTGTRPERTSSSNENRGATDTISGSSADPEIVLQMGHESWVNGTVLTPDGRYAVSASESIKIWDIESGFLIREIVLDQDSNARSLAIAADGRTLVVGHKDGTITLRSFPSCEVSQTLENGHRESVQALQLTQDGRSLVSGSADGTAILWSLPDGTPVRRFSVGSTVSSVDIYARGNRIITGSLENGATVWDAAGGAELFHAGSPDGYAYAVGFSGDGGSFFVTEAGAETNIYSTFDFSVLRSFPGERCVNNRGVRFLPGGREIVLESISDARRIYGIWEVASGALNREFFSVSATSRPTYTENIQSAYVDPTRPRIIAGFQTGEAVLYDTSSGELAQSFGEPTPPINHLAVSPDGRRFLTSAFKAGGRERIILWDRESGRALWSHQLESSGYWGMVHDLAFLPDGESFIAAYGNTLAVHRVSDGEPIDVILRGGPDPGNVDISSDGTRLLVCRGSGGNGWRGWMELLNLSSGELIRKFEGHTNDIDGAAISPDGHRIVSASRDGTARLWDVATGREIQRYDTRGWGYTAGWSPDGRDYYFGDGAGTHVYDAATGTLRFTLDSRTWDSTRYTADGRFIVTSVSNGFKVWSADTGNLVTASDRLSVRSFDLTPDGRFVVSGSSLSTCSVSTVADAALVYTSAIGEETETLTWIPEFYFTGSERLAKSTVCIVQGMTPYAIDQFFESFYRPDVVQAKIEGRDISALAGERDLAAIISPTPGVTITVKDASGRTISTGSGRTDITDDRVTIALSVEDRGGGVDEVRLFHNGARVGGGTRGLARVGDDTLTFEVRLLNGENQFDAVAFTTTRVESEPVTVVLQYDSPDQARPVLRILAVGINDYANDRYDLNYAVNDARGFVRAVEEAGAGLYADIDTVIVTDGDATGDGIRVALASIASRAEPQDVFLFFYAGHGIALDSETTERTEFFFIPTDVTQMTSMSQVESLGVSGPEFEDLVGAIPARKQFLILDACNSGAINEAFLARGAAEEIALSRLNRATGSTLIAASREDQFAQEFAELGQGALTKTLLNGLAGGAALANGQITVGSLKSYVESELPALTEQYLGRAQYPMGFVFGQDFPIGLQQDP